MKTLVKQSKSTQNQITSCWEDCPHYPTVHLLHRACSHISWKQSGDFYYYDHYFYFLSSYYQILDHQDRLYLNIVCKCFPGEVQGKFSNRYFVQTIIPNIIPHVFKAVHFHSRNQQKTRSGLNTSVILLKNVLDYLRLKGPTNSGSFSQRYNGYNGYPA